MHLLQHYLKEVQVLTWEFFMNRLDTLALEAHVDKEQNKEFPFPMGEKSQIKKKKTNTKSIYFYHSFVVFTSSKC